MFNNSSHIQVDMYNSRLKPSTLLVVVVMQLSEDNQPQELANWISQVNFNEQQEAAFGKHTKGYCSRKGL